MNENFIEDIKKALRLYVDREHNGVTSQAEKALGLAEGSGLLSKWLKPRGDKGERVPSLLQIAPLFPQLGIRSFSRGRSSLWNRQIQEDWKRKFRGSNWN